MFCSIISMTTNCPIYLHREIVPPRETMAIARVAIAIVGRGGWGSLPYTVANEKYWIHESKICFVPLSQWLQIVPYIYIGKLCHRGKQWQLPEWGEVDEEAFRSRWQMKIKWRHRQHCEWSRQQHVLLYVLKWQMIRFQALWKTKSFVKVWLKFKLPLWTKGLLIHLSPLWQLPLWHFPRWHNSCVYFLLSWWGSVIALLSLFFKCIVIADVAVANATNDWMKSWFIFTCTKQKIRKVVFKKTVSCNMSAKLEAIMFTLHTQIINAHEMRAFHKAYACYKYARFWQSFTHKQLC